MTESYRNDTTSSTQDFTLRVEDGLRAFDSAQWQKLSGASRTGEQAYNPFVSYAYLSALEDSGCASTQTGWLAKHLRLQDSRGNLMGAAACYLKSHSQGEYVFDHGWADAFERAGGQYYPKLQVSVPFTPATGPRLLAHPGESADSLRLALAGGLKTLTDRHSISSAHATFVAPEEMAIFDQSGFLHRTDQQFHFVNHNYNSYDDFLSTLASRKRKALRKERRLALQEGITIEWLTGSDLTEEIWDIFHAFYMETGSRKWGQPYLNRTFFSLIGERMAEDIVLVMARRDGRYVAGAINFLGSKTIFGRHWGCVEQHPYLHFEICYHQAIDYAIANRLAIVEAGAQGEHKLARGYVPVVMHSAHYIPHPGFRRAVEEYLAQERREVERVGEILHAHAPFRKGPLE